MWTVIEIKNGWSVWDTGGCEIVCERKFNAKLLADRLNSEKICGNTILPKWVKDYQK